MENLLPWLGPVIAAGALLYTIAANRGKAADARVANGETRISALEKQVAELRGDLDHVPDKDVSHRLEMAIARIEGRVDVMAERLQPVAAISERLQEFLLEQARR